MVSVWVLVSGPALVRLFLCRASASCFPSPKLAKGLAHLFGFWAVGLGQLEEDAVFGRRGTLRQFPAVSPGSFLCPAWQWRGVDRSPSLLDSG